MINSSSKHVGIHQQWSGLTRGGTVSADLAKYKVNSICSSMTGVRALLIIHPEHPNSNTNTDSRKHKYRFKQGKHSSRKPTKLIILQMCNEIKITVLIH